MTESEEPTITPTIIVGAPPPRNPASAGFAAQQTETTLTHEPTLAVPEGNPPSVAPHASTRVVVQLKLRRGNVQKTETQKCERAG